MAETNDYTLDEILETVKELPSDTSVRHWLFNTDKNTYYVIIFYFMSRLGNQWGVYRCNKKGQRKGDMIAKWPGHKDKNPWNNIEKFIEEELKLQFEPEDVEEEMTEAELEAQILAEETAESLDETPETESED